MKRINIINKAVAAISILLCALSLAACGNAVDALPESAENTTQGISAKVQIKMSGAAPSRSATSSFTDTITWYITAMSSDYSADQGQVISGALASAFSSTNTFTMDIPKAGTYSFTVLGYPGLYTKAEQLTSLTPLFQGAKESVEISKTGLASSLVISVAPLFTGSQPQNADPSEATVTTAKGSINLKISDESGLISKVTASLAAYQKDTDPIKKEATFTSGITLLNITDVPAGKYTATLKFEDSAGNIRYSCNEAINVYSGMTTDTWYGTAPYFITNAGKSSFVLNQTIINSYAAELVPSTNYVLYNNNNGTCQYYLKDSPSEAVSGTADFSSSQSSFCFDADGNFYYLTQSGSDYVINKSTGQLGSFSPQNSSIPSIIVDLATNTMYSWCLNESQILIRKFPNLISDGDTSNSTDYEINSPSMSIDGESINPWPDMCTINNGIAYVIVRDTSSQDTGSYICRAPLQGTGYSLTQADCVNLGLKENGAKDADVNDLIYQDGNVYILISESNTQLTPVEDKIISRGGVLKYNILTKTLDSKMAGWTSTGQNRENKWLQVGWISGGDLMDLLYTSENRIGEIFAKADDSTIPDNFSILSPETPLGQLSNKAFYGPKSFVAIKPKKLVILDEGIAFYTDAEGLYKYKNVNRIVTVDLEDFAITETSSVPESITFNNDETGLKPHICSYYWQPVLYNEEHEVIFDASDGTSTISLHSFEHMWGQANPETVNLDASQENWYTATGMAIPLGDD